MECAITDALPLCTVVQQSNVSIVLDPLIGATHS